MNEFLKRLSEADDLNEEDSVNRTTDLTAQACGISKHSTRRICLEVKRNVEAIIQSTASGIFVLNHRVKHTLWS